MRNTILLGLGLSIFFVFAFLISSETIFAAYRNKVTNKKTTQPKNINTPTQKQPSQGIKMLKDVGEAYMDHFGLTETDFINFKKMGVNLIEGNFDICATDTDIRFLLDNADRNNIKVIMPAGSGEAEWSYKCNQEPYPKSQKPVWNKTAVTKFINKWKSHPAIYGWDTSNEAGSVLPNANPDTYANMLTLVQIQQAYKDVKAADPNRPVMIRQNGWFYYDDDKNFFKRGNPYTSNVADIVMINAYSNVEEYFPDFVSTVMNRSQKAILEVDPKVKFIVSLGVWNEPPLWKKPTTQQLQNDLNQYKKLNNVMGIAYFKYGANGSEWYMPKDSKDLLPQITNN